MTEHIAKAPHLRPGSAVEDPSVFVSYRRDDASGSAGRLHDDLTERLGASRVFRDRDLRPGTNWVEQLRSFAGACHVMLVVIGPRWVSVVDDAGRSRLHEPSDQLRLEVETA